MFPEQMDARAKGFVRREKIREREVTPNIPHAERRLEQEEAVRLKLSLPGLSRCVEGLKQHLFGTFEWRFPIFYQHLNLINNAVVL